MITNKMLFWRFVSLYELGILLIIVYTIILTKSRSTQNYRILKKFLVWNLITHIMVSISKNSLGSLEINRRPKDARNCNSLSMGGDCSSSPGFPSGHSTGAAFIFMYFLIHQNCFVTWKKTIIFWFTLAFCILVPIARVQMKCHTLIQVFAGVTFGFFTACLSSWFPS